MFLFLEPDTTDIRTFIQDRAPLPFNYEEVAWTRNGRTPRGYNRGSYRIRLGSGREMFEHARKAIQNWKMFGVDWVRLCWPYKPVQPGTTVAIATNHVAFWTLNCARVVYLADTPRQFAFACGCVEDHSLRGEERFEITWREDDSVWYEINSFSKPNHWFLWLVYPLAAFVQDSFRRATGEAMIRCLAASVAEEKTPVSPAE